jgi:hypothetical protein
VFVFSVLSMSNQMSSDLCCMNERYVGARENFHELARDPDTLAKALGRARPFNSEGFFSMRGATNQISTIVSTTWQLLVGAEQRVLYPITKVPPTLMLNISNSVVEIGHIDSTDLHVISSSVVH